MKLLMDFGDQFALAGFCRGIIPKAFDHRVGPTVAKAVAEAARRTGVAYAAAAHRTIL